MRFKKGQEVVCTRDNGGNWAGRWKSTNEPTRGKGPKYGEVVTVVEYYEGVYLRFEEYNQLNERMGFKWFNEKWFEPVITTTELESLLQEEPETINVNV